MPKKKIVLVSHFTYTTIRKPHIIKVDRGIYMFNKRFPRQMPMQSFGMQDAMIDIDNNTGNIDIDLMQQGANNNNGGNMGGMASSPIIEPMQQRVVQRTILHEVPHVCPINTKIVNNHVFRHTYRPNYTCCEENICTNVQCGSCCNY